MSAIPALTAAYREAERVTSRMMDRLRLWWAAKRAEAKALERRRNEVEEYIANLAEGRDPDA
jgi:hypothetical protein